MSRSVQEEILSALYLIAGLLAIQCGIKWLAAVCFGKAALDAVCAIVFAVREAYGDVVAARCLKR